LREPPERQGAWLALHYPDLYKYRNIKCIRALNLSLFAHYMILCMIPLHISILSIYRFRTTNYKLPIELGRWQNVAREKRKCLLCNSVDIGDEFHYICSCSKFNNRNILCMHKFRNRQNSLKFSSLMNSNGLSDVYNLCKFIRIVNQRLDSLV
jgi:hypothetical protein